MKEKSYFCFDDFWAAFDENDKQRMIRSSDQKDLRKLPAMLRNKRWSVGRDTDVNVDIDKDVIQTQARGLEAWIINTVGF